MNRGLIHPRLVVVTGGGSGIGRETAVAFADGGATVIIADINEVTASETVSMIRDQGRTAFNYLLDVADGGAWDRFGALVRDQHGVPDVVVNNAGIYIDDSFLELSTADWERMLAIDLSSVVHGCRVFAAQMIDRGQGGHLVNVASGAAFGVSRTGTAYFVSKAGVKMLSESLRSELSGTGIGVSVICPGLIKTNINPPEDLRAILPVIAADPDTVARAIVRSVRYNWAIVPVRPEAWLMYGLRRLSPGLWRVVAQRFIVADVLEKVIRLIPSRRVGPVPS